MTKTREGCARRSRRPFWLGLVAIGVFTTPGLRAQGELPQHVTFTKDIAPTLQRSCQQCHSPSGLAPMPFTTYEEVRPWARSMKQQPSLRDMPPWFIEKDIGIQRFKDDISMSDEEIATIAAWVTTAHQGAILPTCRRRESFLLRECGPVGSRTWWSPRQCSPCEPSVPTGMARWTNWWAER